MSVTPNDVEFLNDPAGQPNRVKVTVYRTAARGNPVSTLIARYFGASRRRHRRHRHGGSVAGQRDDLREAVHDSRQVDRSADTAVGRRRYATTHSTTRASRSADPDVYIPRGSARIHRIQPGEQPRSAARHSRGDRQQYHSRASTFHSRSESRSITGGDEYRWNIGNCNKTIYHWGDPLIAGTRRNGGPTDPGRRGPDRAGIRARTGTRRPNSVKGSAYNGQSPRVFPIPLYDPIVYDSGKRNGRTADLVTANWIGFFIESTQGNGIVRAHHPHRRYSGRDAAAGPHGLFPKPFGWCSNSHSAERREAWRSLRQQSLRTMKNSNGRSHDCCGRAACPWASWKGAPRRKA